METTIQLILAVSVLSLTAIFVTVGIWVILILKDFKNLINKLGAVGDDIRETTAFAKDKIKESFNLVALLTSLGNIWSQKTLNKTRENGETKKKLIARKTVEKRNKKSEPPKPKRRFFFKKK